jgi:hypothetical protein
MGTEYHGFIDLSRRKPYILRDLPARHYAPSPPAEADSSGGSDRRG